MDDEKSFICLECNRVFPKKYLLTRHKVMHGPKKFVCDVCSKSFARKDTLMRHVKMHFDENEIFECNECSKIFIEKRYLIRHLKDYCSAEKSVKGDETEAYFKCGFCKTSFSNKTWIRKHFRSQHKIDLKSESRSFPSFAEFQEWRQQIQRQDITQFISQAKWHSKSETTRVFACHRSGQLVSKSSLSKFPSRHGSKKLQMYCPAEMRVKVKHADGSCHVKYVMTHIGHKVQDPEEICFVSLDREEKLDIVSQMRLDGAARRALHQQKLLRTADIENVTVGAAPTDDMGLVDAFVERNADCVLYYKKPNTRDTRFRALETDDFVLVLMNRWQERLLRLYGHRMIAFDGTRAARSEYLLHTLLVLNVDREGVPVCFVLTNRSDQVAISIFVWCIRDRVGVLAPTTVMTDMQNSYSNCWQQVMQNAPKYRLFCTWHVIGAWKKQWSRINDASRRDDVKQATFDLLLEPNPVLFEEKLRVFLSSANSDTEAFVEYFGRHFVETAPNWAYCYRQNSGVHSNMALEAFHHILKYDHSDENELPWLAHTLACLEKYLVLREHDEVIQKTGNKRFSKLDNLRRKHHLAKRFVDQHDVADVVTIVDERSFLVCPFDGVEKSTGSKMYVVTKIVDEQMNEFRECCSYGSEVVCRLPCELCQICFHEYSCNCTDASVKNNMCVHIHAVGIFLQNRASTGELGESCALVESELSFDWSDGEESGTQETPAKYDQTWHGDRLDTAVQDMYQIIDKVAEEAKQLGLGEQHLQAMITQYLKPMLLTVKAYGSVEKQEELCLCPKLETYQLVGT